MKVTFIFLSASSLLYANPEGLSIASGEVALTENGAALEIIVSDRAILNWDSFSIAQNEVISFIQPGAEAAVLNRVTGTEISEIQGLLEAQGQVYLVNQNGVVIGAEGRIDTTVFIASSLDLTNESFLANRAFAFNSESAGDIVNLGTIETTHGHAVLLGRHIENSGTIHASSGDVAIGSGKSILFDPTGDALIYIQAAHEEGMAPSVSLAISGEIGATQISEEGGNVYLSGETIEVDPDAVITANGTISIETPPEPSNVALSLLEGSNASYETNLNANYTAPSNGATIQAGNGNITFTSGVSITSGATPITLETTGTGKLILISDNNFPSSPNFGTGRVTLPQATLATGGGELLIYTSQRDLNTLPATINGTAFVEGPKYIDSATEKWGTYYPNSSGIPFTVFYKEFGSPPSPPPPPPPPPSPSAPTAVPETAPVIASVQVANVESVTTINEQSDLNYNPVTQAQSGSTQPNIEASCTSPSVSISM